MERKLYDAASKLPEPCLSFDEISAVVSEKTANSGRRSWKAAAVAAACFLILFSAGLGTYAYAAEVQEYNNAVQFFETYDLSTVGLTRGEIKAVYRDITTKAFRYSKTAEVIEESLSRNCVVGYELLQENPTPEDVENLWNYAQYNGNYWTADPDYHRGVHYQYRSEYKLDEQLGFDVHDSSYLEKYDGDTLLWSVCLPEFRIDDFCIVSDGVIAYGENDIWSSEQDRCAWMAKIDPDGKLLWKKMLDHGFEDESIAAILEDADGSYGVFSRGNLKYLCFCRYAAGGEEVQYQITQVGNYGIWNAASFGDGYIVQLGSYNTNEHAMIVKIDHDGRITQSFSYGSQDAYYYITDMIEFDGRMYLSAYAVPNLTEEAENAGGRYEIGAICNYLFENDIWEISSEELTPMVRDNYTAVLMVCEPVAGSLQEFYSVKGSLGSKLSLGDSGTLQWNVECITTTFFSPMTSSFTIGGTSHVFRYTFDTAGQLMNQEKTGEIAPFNR